MTTAAGDGQTQLTSVARVAAPLREQVIDALRQAIMEFRLKPGQRLVERELIEWLGVSRTTIREAIRELASEGLVTVVPQKGARVSAPSRHEAVDLYEVRASLESLIVRRFVERATDEQVARLVAAVDEYEHVVNTSDEIHSVLTAKSGFYRVLVEGAASAPLQQILEGIQARVQMLRVTSLSQPGRLVDVVAELREIVEAIQRRNAARASRLCAEHIMMAAHTALGNLPEGD
ncbi:GntR family transcriptional regulator [Tamaricihabitans halophyticus]|uniref:GntR family transcriptional regulator n=1 Tax=Tamaricihabitans halophyticus TaxID=1262583 RepID=A0A4R2QTN7_9PSEU|nr:GntR family transcriptional regulator [Tamaricihabitans halophyticus]TCP53067.1 GntR family transcriptional regulator [Tamaricihabitans halophyticus]